VVNDSRARILFTGAEFVPVVEKIRDTMPSVERVVVLGEEYERLLAGHEPVAEPYEPDPDDAFLQLYTSGTTGFPKGAMLTHRGMDAHGAMVAETFELTGESSSMVPMPLFHVGGSSWALAGIRAGARTVVVREAVPGPLLDEFERERISHAFVVPAVLGFLLQVPDVAERDYSHLRALLYGGSAMPLPLLRKCLATFPVDFWQVYGMTEMCGVVTVLPPADHHDETHTERLVSAGVPVDGVELRISSPLTGDELPPGEVGEVWVRSAQRMKGYWQLPQASAEAVAGDGWLRTGDAGHLDADGYLFIQDRVKDMIITGGENVYPAEVERVLAEHPAVADVAVIGVPDERWGESIKAVIVAEAGSEPAEDELIAYCRERLAGFKCPKSVDLVAELPRNPTGKVLKRTLREPYWAGRERRV
jgi:acyl-CoA synthetase (AMP-forming)/AMP-acid ligase II